MKYIESLGFFSKHDKMANSLYSSMKDNINKNDFEIRKHGDYKFSVEFRGEEIEVNKFPSGSYSLTISNVKYDVSSRMCRKIWFLLEEKYNSSKFRVDDLNKKFEEIETGNNYIDNLGKEKDTKVSTNRDIISEFKKKKGVIDSIFSKDNEDGKIDSLILKDVFGGDSKLQNPICKGYVSMKRVERSISKIDDSLVDFKNDISDINQRISDLNDKSSSNPDMSDYYNSQILNQKKSIDNVNKSISERNKRMLDLKKRISEEKKAFKSILSRFL